MPSSFDSTDLFGSGPHRFHLGPFGQQIIQRTTLDPGQAGTQAIGPLDADIRVRGRLVADDDSALWSLINTIAAKLTDPPTVANLNDLHGHSFKDFAFISFTPADRIDRGSKVSMAYEARFIHFGGWPTE